MNKEERFNELAKLLRIEEFGAIVADKLIDIN